MTSSFISLFILIYEIVLIVCFEYLHFISVNVTFQKHRYKWTTSVKQL